MDVRKRVVQGEIEWFLSTVSWEPVKALPRHSVLRYLQRKWKEKRYLLELYVWKLGVQVDHLSQYVFCCQQACSTVTVTVLQHHYRRTYLSKCLGLKNEFSFWVRYLANADDLYCLRPLHMKTYAYFIKKEYVYHHVFTWASSKLLDQKTLASVELSNTLAYWGSGLHLRGEKNGWQQPTGLGPYEGHLYAYPRTWTSCPKGFKSKPERKKGDRLW